MPKGTVTALELDTLEAGPEVTEMPKSAKGTNSLERARAILAKVQSSASGTLSNGKRYPTTAAARAAGMPYSRSLEKAIRADESMSDRGAKFGVTRNAYGFVWAIWIGERVTRTRKNKDDSTTPRTPEPKHRNGNAAAAA